MFPVSSLRCEHVLRTCCWAALPLAILPRSAGRSPVTLPAGLMARSRPWEICAAAANGGLSWDGSVAFCATSVRSCCDFCHLSFRSSSRGRACSRRSSSSRQRRWSGSCRSSSPVSAAVSVCPSVGGCAVVSH